MKFEPPLRFYEPFYEKTESLSPFIWWGVQACLNFDAHMEGSPEDDFDFSKVAGVQTIPIFCTINEYGWMMVLGGFRPIFDSYCLIVINYSDGMMYRVQSPLPVLELAVEYHETLFRELSQKSIRALASSHPRFDPCQLGFESCDTVFCGEREEIRQDLWRGYVGDLPRPTHWIPKKPFEFDLG